MRKQIIIGLVGLSLAAGIVMMCKSKEASDKTPEKFTEHISKNEYIEELYVPVKKMYKAYSFIPLDAYIQIELMKYCAEKGIAHDIIFAMIKTESEFQWVIGDDGQAVGYMQIWPIWWNAFLKDKGIDLYTECGNIQGGIEILQYLLHKTGGDLRAALIAYNGGYDYPDKVFANMLWIEDRKGGM